MTTVTKPNWTVDPPVFSYSKLWHLTNGNVVISLPEEAIKEIATTYMEVTSGPGRTRLSSDHPTIDNAIGTDLDAWDADPGHDRPGGTDGGGNQEDKIHCPEGD